MKKLLLIIVCVFHFSYLRAQREVYLDTNQNEISLKQFNEHLLETKTGWSFIVKDATYYYTPSKSYKLGKLNENDLKLFLHDLKTNYQIQAGTNQVIYLGYYGDTHYKFNHFKNITLTKYGHFSDYETSRQYKFIDVPKAKLAPINFHSQELLKSEYYYKLKLTKIDSLGIMKKIFQQSYPYNSSVYLKPNGDYLIIYGISVHRPDLNKQIKYFVEN